MTQSTSNSSSAATVNEEGILEKVLGTCQRHKTGVDRTLQQKIHHVTSSSSSPSEGTSACVDPHVEEYLCRSYDQNLQMYESHQMMQELLVQLHPTIQFLTTTLPEPYVPLGPPPPSDASDDDVSNAANLGDSQLFYIFLIFFY